MSSTTIDYTRPPLYRKQAAFVDSDKRYTIVEASTKTGKTVACLVWILELAMQGKDGFNYWWVAPTFAQAGIAYGRLKRWLKQSGVPHTSGETDQTINLPNGVVMWFKGADKPDSLYGEDVYGAVIDEATRCKEDAWHAVRSTLTATRGPVKIIGNVRGRKNWAYNLARQAESGSFSNMAHFKLTAYDAVDAGVLDLAEVEDAKSKLPEGVFQELFLAEPADDGGNPFGIDSIRRCLGPLSTKPPVAIGVDLAKSVDWTVVCGLDEDRSTCLLEHWQSDWGQTRRRLSDMLGTTPALIDSTGVGDPIVEDLIREKTWVKGYKFTSQSKQQLMEGLAAVIQRGEIRFPAGWLQVELETFEYEYKAGGVRYSAPEGLHDDGVCALALAVQHWTDKRGRDIEVKLIGPKPDRRGILGQQEWVTVF